MKHLGQPSDASNDSYPLVSVLCTAYNHEAYIKQTLDGFVSQKTSFSYEVLVSDDRSSDRTAEIILEYSSRYPEIIKPFILADNHYSKGISITKTVLLPAARGKYIAFCEGDDYWNDVHKLQRQIDYMCAHPDCVLCLHAANIIAEDGSFRRRSVPEGPDLDISTEQLISSEFYTQYASIVTVKDVYSSLTVTGDYPVKISLSLHGRVHFLNSVMCAYRTHSKGSWTERVQNDAKLAKHHYQSRITFLKKLDSDTGGKYSEVIRREIRKYQFVYLYKTRQYSAKQKMEYKEIYERKKGREKIIFWMQVNYPNVFRVLRKLIRRY